MNEDGPWQTIPFRVSSLLQFSSGAKAAKMRKRVIIHWGLSSFFGWGVYGLNLSLAWAGDRDVEPLCSFPLRQDHIVIDPLNVLRMREFMRASGAFAEQLKPFSGGTATVDAPMLAGLGFDFQLAPAVHDVMLAGRPTVGVTFFERSRLDADAVERAKVYSCIITGSTWNERVLRAHGVENVFTILQGIDPTLFHPAPRSGYHSGRFLVFSGGKLERRKGQDIVLAAFARFAQAHPDALLVTAWHSPWAPLAKTLDDGSQAGPVVFTPEGRLDTRGWAAANGIPADQVLDLGNVPNAFMPPVLREMDVAVFPNRCEGGTNLVAMEAMACGVPVILSANTGHLDLIREDNCFTLDEQGTVQGEESFGGVPGWGESSVDEVVERLEQVYRDRAEAQRRGARGAAMLAGLTWKHNADAMKTLLFERSSL